MRVRSLEVLGADPASLDLVKSTQSDDQTVKDGSRKI